jgi:outer membrane protein OmpA-like peptidoglycan-associated protein
MWTEPKNLGPQINSPYDERSPFLAHDGRTLYFSSNHTGSMGGLDIYKSIFEDAKQMWQTPVNLGAGINSPADDAYFRLAADGRTAYFSSDRLASIGQRDIFIAYFRDEQPEQTHTSVPALFTEAGKNAAPRKESVDQQQLSIPVLLYDNDRDLVSDESRKVYDKVSALARTYPEANVLVTVHTDESGPAKFDLYNGIKRGEIVGKALVEKGVSAGKIAIRSCGSAYPVARNVLDAVPNPAGQHLNRRVEIGIVWADNQAPATITMERPQVSALMAADGGQKLDAATRGLSYKIEVATTRQILNNDVLFMYSDLMIESQPGSGAYRYTSGWVRQYQDALRLKQELQHQDFSDALIVAYINGVRISKAEAVGLLQKYPDLVAYVKG